MTDINTQNPEEQKENSTNLPQENNPSHPTSDQEQSKVTEQPKEEDKPGLASTTSQPEETDQQPEKDSKNKPTQSHSEEEEEKSTSAKESPQKTQHAALSATDDDQEEYYGIPVKAYDEMNLDALSEELERLIKNHKVKEIRHHVRKLKMEFDAQFREQREQKKEKFLNEGGNIIDFSYSIPAERKLNKLYFNFKEKRDNYYKELHQNFQENLERRLGIIEELKSITGEGSDMNANFKRFKKIQERWHQAGPVPRTEYKDTWNTYHHHVERFYDFLHLDREFREMDYKHNLEQKLKMVARAEELGEEKNVNRAFRELQDLHRMWKEDVGPVAKEYREDIWEKFSAATKKIHGNRKAYFAERDKQREKHMEAKQKVIAAIEKLEKEKITSHRQAQNKIKKFKSLRDAFFKAGKVPQKHNKEIWNAFKTASRKFNHKKNSFYKDQKQEQKENFERKMELVELAEKHKDSEDFDEVTPLMKKIQSDWKKIGYVPRHQSEKIWKRFKKACNHYFDRLHTLQDDKEKAKLKVFEQKKTLLDEVKNLSLSGNKEEDLPKIKEKINQWKNLGEVPGNKKSIEGQFNKVLDKLFSKLDINRKEAELLKYEKRLKAIDEDEDDYKYRKETSFLNKKISQTSEEVRNLEINLQRFDNADKNNPLLKDTFLKIDQLKQQLKIWEAKLDKLKQL